MLHSTRIRSSHQRRILDWLADGGGTVTEISKALKLRVPHTSAAIKKLREMGDVVRDDHNLRGSQYRLSSQGLNRLEADALERLLDLVQWPPPPSAAGIVLAREGSMLLLGYTSIPTGPMLALPNRPMDGDSGVLPNSSGNEGAPSDWRWAVARGEGAKWYNLDTRRKTDPPNQSTPTTLSAWMDSPKVMGIVRARLLEQDSDWPLGVGSWFEQIPEGYWPQLPYDLRDGEMPIGRAGNSGPLVKPQGAIHAKLTRRSDVTKLLRSLDDNLYLVADSFLIGEEKSPIPYGVIKHWLMKIHPRLGAEVIKEKSEKLISNLQKKQSTAMTRRLLIDFPGSEWIEDNDYIDTTGLSAVAGESVLAMLLAKASKKIIVHWKWNDPCDELYKLSRDDRCKILIAPNFESNLPFQLVSIDNQLILKLPSRVNLPITFESNNTFKMPKDWSPPQAPSQLVRGEMTNPPDVDNELEALWIACSLGESDDAWADRHERKFPLAAWIASNDSSRVSRWRRISNEIESKWATLCEFSEFDLSDLCEIALEVESAFDELIRRIRNNPLLVYQNAESHQYPAMCAAILLSINWFNDVPNVVQNWLKNPIKVKEINRVCWNSPLIKEIIHSSESHSILYNDAITTKEEALDILKEVHFDLWKDKSVNLLTLAISTSTGRNQLAEISLPWPVILCDQNIESSQLALVHHMKNGPGTDALLDCYEGLVASESNETPPQGRIHDLAGWLFQSRVPIVGSKIQGNMDVHMELYRRVQQ